MALRPTRRTPTVAVLAGWAVVTLPSFLAAQQVTLTPYSAYRLGGSVDIRGGKLSLENSAIVGGQLDFRVRPDATVSLTADYQPTTLRAKMSGEPKETLSDMDVWYFQVGGLLEQTTGEGVVPYAMATLGMSWFDPAASGADSETGLAGIFGIGAKIPGRPGGIGLRLQARVLLNSISAHSSLWCGIGSGCQIGVGGPIGPVQFDFGGGLTLGGR